MRVRCKRVLFVLIASIISCFLVAQYNLGSSQKQGVAPMTFSWKSRVKLRGHLAKIPARKTASEVMKQLVGAGLRDVPGGGVPGRPEYRQPSRSSHNILGIWRANQQRVIDELRELINRNVRSNDPRILALIRRSLVAPSTGPLKPSHGIHMTRQSSVVDNILGAKTHGFFLEAGATDGEGSSDTIWLEHMRQWDGLLIEPDPAYFLQLLGKNRRAWAINACLSRTTRPTVMEFPESEWQLGQAVGAQLGRPQTHVPCYPLHVLLEVLNNSCVDFLSLNVKGAEWDVLHTIPWDDLDISTLAVRCSRNDVIRQQIPSYMAELGYRSHSREDYTNPQDDLWDNDLIFARRETQDDDFDEYLR